MSESNPFLSETYESDRNIIKHSIDQYSELISRVQGEDKEVVKSHFGEKATDFLEAGMFITFKDDAPQELKDYCFVHQENNLVEGIKENDEIIVVGQNKLDDKKPLLIEK